MTTTIVYVHPLPPTYGAEPSRHSSTNFIIKWLLLPGMSFTSTLQYEQADPTGLLCMNSAWVMRPSIRSEHRYSGARTGTTSSGRSDTNIIRSRIAPRVRCGRVAGVLAPQERNFGMWQDTVIARSHGFADVLVFRLPRRMVLLCRSGSRRSTSIKNSEPVTNAKPVRGPSCVGSDTFFQKHLAQPRMFLSFRRISHPQNIIFGQPKSGPSLLI